MRVLVGDSWGFASSATLNYDEIDRVTDLAIEIESSRSVGLLKQEIYLRLGVRELWTLTNDGKLLVRVREKSGWREARKSRLLPALDLGWLVSFLEIEPQSRAVLAIRDSLRQTSRSRKRRRT